MILKGVNIPETIELPASKSLCNRLYMIRFLAGDSFKIENESDANDCVVLKHCLQKIANNSTSEIQIINAEDAGTVYRFLTALLCMADGDFILTGTERMQQRPIGELVKALKDLGANITYQDQDNFPPLLIHGDQKSLKNKGNIEIDLSESSQYLSALLLIAPYIENGLAISIKNKIVSEPYLQMTIGLMKEFGINVDGDGRNYNIKEGKYQYEGSYFVEADWSAASYFYAWGFLTKKPISIQYLFQKSWQGDQKLIEIFEENFSLKSIFEKHQLRLNVDEIRIPEKFEYDFTDTPDIAPTFVVLCAILGIEGIFKGVEHLKIKESDRMNVLKFNLEKIGIILNEHKDNWKLESHRIDLKNIPKVVFDSYNDHRMAMSLSLFASVISEIEILNADCVKKSFPKYFSQLN